MEKKVLSKDELLEQKDKLLEQYYGKQSKSKRMARLAKKEKRDLNIGKDQACAHIKSVGIPSTKAKLVIDLIKGKPLNEAYAILEHTPNAASEIIYKLIKSAEANAVNNNEMDEDSLYVYELYANQGPTLKRIQPRAQGRAYRIRKRTCHISVVLKERVNEEVGPWGKK